MDGPLIELSLCDGRCWRRQNHIFPRQYVALFYGLGEGAIISIAPLFRYVHAVTDIGRARLDRNQTHLSYTLIPALGERLRSGNIQEF